MNDYMMSQALAAWRELMLRCEVRRNPQQQYEELLSAADKYQRDGTISVGERNDLILEATRYYASAVEELAQEGESLERTRGHSLHT